MNKDLFGWKKVHFVWMITVLMALMLLPVKTRAAIAYTPSNVKAEPYGTGQLKLSFDMLDYKGVTSYNGINGYNITSYNKTTEKTGGEVFVGKDTYSGTTTVIIDLSKLCPESGAYIFSVQAVGYTADDVSPIGQTTEALTINVSSGGSGGSGGSGNSYSSEKPTEKPTFSGLKDYSEYNLNFEFGWYSYYSEGVNQVNVYRDNKKVATLDVYTNSYVDKTVVPGATYKYQVSFSNSSGEGPKSDILTVTIPKPPLKKPSAFSVTTGIGKATVSFTNNSLGYGYPTAGYEIYKDGKKVSSGSYNGYVSKTFTISETAKTKFKVRSYVTVKKKTFYSAYTSVKTVQSKKIGKPKGVSVTKINANAAGLSWNPVTGANSYIVYKGSKAVKTTKKTALIYKAKGAGKGAYHIEAVRKIGKKKYKTKSKNAKPKANQCTYSVNKDIKSVTYSYAPFRISKISLSGNTYTVTGYVVNNRIYKLQKYKKLNINIYCNGKKVAYKTFKNLKVNCKDSGVKKLTVKIKGKGGVDLRNSHGYQTQWQEYWQYVGTKRLGD